MEPNVNYTIEDALKQLKANLSEVARVYEWADLMGYEDPKRFSEKILRHYGVRPQKMMELVRLESIIQELRSQNNYSNLRIARMHSIPDEKTLNNFTNYHLGLSPTALRNKPKEEVSTLLEMRWRKILEDHGVQNSEGVSQLILC